MKRPRIKTVLSAGRRLWRDGKRSLPGFAAAGRHDVAPPTEPKVKTGDKKLAGYVSSQLQAATELLRARRFEEAESVLNDALTRHPDHPDLLECLGRVAQRDGRWADALRHWQNLSEAYPNRVEASVNRIKMLTKLQRFADAEQALRVTRERWPDHPKLIEAVALAAQRDMRWNDALVHWEDLTHRHPGRLNAWIRRIKVLVELQRSEEASDVLRTTMDRWPDHPKLKEARAHALEGEQRWSEALKCWRNLSTTHPSHSVSHVGQHIAMCEIKLGRVGEAGKSLEEAIGAREEAAIFQRIFGSQAPFISYYGRRIEDVFRDLG